MVAEPAHRWRSRSGGRRGGGGGGRGWVLFLSLVNSRCPLSHDAMFRVFFICFRSFSFTFVWRWKVRVIIFQVYCPGEVMFPSTFLYTWV